MTQMNKGKKRVSSLDARFYKLIDYFLIALLVISVLVFILYPIVSVIKNSFIIDGKFSLEMYNKLFKTNKKLLYNSLFVAFMTTIVSTIIATSVSIYISFSNRRLRNLLTFVLMLTMISPPFVSSLAYINLFGRRGFITHRLLGLTMNTYGWQGIVSMQSLSYGSLNALILIGVIQGINKNLIDGSLDLGASSSYTIRKVVLPLMRPGILVVALLTFIRSLADFGTPMNIGGNFNVLATEAYLNVIAYSNLSMASTMSILLFIPSIIVFLIYRAFMKENNIAVGNDISRQEETSLKLKGFFPFLVKVITFVFLLAMLLQYISIFVSALTKRSYGKLKFTGEYIKAVKDYNLDSFIRSIVYSLIAGLLSAFIGFIMAYYMEIRKLKGMKLLDFFATMPYIIPGTFFGIGYILAFNNKPLELTGTSLIVILNCIFKQLTMPIKVNTAGMGQINPQVLDAGKDLGGGDFFVLKDIVSPMSKRSFLVSFINGFTSTMTTVGSIIFLVYPGRKLATLVMFDAIQTGKYGVGSAIACLIILITLLVNIVFSKFILEDKNVSRN